MRDTIQGKDMQNHCHRSFKNLKITYCPLVLLKSVFLKNHCVSSHLKLLLLKKWVTPAIKELSAF